MIKGLFFAAAVLLVLPGLAYAAGPSATQSDQVVPAGSDPAGPPTPPAQATVANFNTCVVCIDFTAASGGVWVNGAQPSGVNAAQPSTWLDCAGASNPIFFHGSNVGTGPTPCQTITTDSSGTQVLEEQMGGVVTIPPNTNYANGMVIGENYGTHNGPVGLVPTNLYVQMVYEIPTFPTSGGSTSSYSQGPWVAKPDGSPEDTTGPSNWLEFDAFEVCCNAGRNAGDYASGFSSWYSNGQFWTNGGATVNWYGTYPNGSNPVAITSHYVTIGMRITSDGNTVYKCMWINDGASYNGKVNCAHYTADNTHLYTWQLSDAASRQAVVISMVEFDNSTSSSFTTPGNMVGWAKSIDIWSCSSWQTTACKTSTADPGGY